MFRRTLVPPPAANAGERIACMQNTYMPLSNERDETEQLAREAIGDFNYGRMLKAAVTMQEVFVTKPTTVSVIPTFGKEVINYTVTVAYDYDERKYTVFLQVTSGDELISIPVDGKVIDTLIRKVDGAKNPMTPEKRERQLKKRLRKANATNHEFVEWPTVAGRCKKCHKGRKTKAHTGELGKGS